MICVVFPSETKWIWNFIWKDGILNKLNIFTVVFFYISPENIFYAINLKATAHSWSYVAFSSLDSQHNTLWKITLFSWVILITGINVCLFDQCEYVVLVQCISCTSTGIEMSLLHLFNCGLSKNWSNLPCVCMHILVSQGLKRPPTNLNISSLYFQFILTPGFPKNDKSQENYF